MSADWISENEQQSKAAAQGSAEIAGAAHPMANSLDPSAEPLDDLRAKLALALRAGHIGLWEWNAATNALRWDARMYEIYGLSAGTPITYERWKLLVHPDDLEAASGIFAPTEQQELRERHLFRIVHPKLGIRWIEAAQEMVLDTEGNLIACIGCDQDVTELQRQLTAPLASVMPTADELPQGLAGSEGLDVGLKAEINRVRRYGGRLSFVTAQVDNFEEIDRQFGPQVGDLFLRAAAQSINDTIRTTDLMAAPGRNVFCIVLPGTMADEARMLGNRIRERLTQGAVYPLNQPLTVSLGIAQWEAGDSAESLLRRAHQSLRRAMAEGSDQICCELSPAAAAPEPPPAVVAALHRPVIFSAQPDFCVHCFRPLVAAELLGQPFHTGTHLCDERILNRKPASPPPYN